MWINNLSLQPNLFEGVFKERMMLVLALYMLLFDHICLSYIQSFIDINVTTIVLYPVYFVAMNDILYEVILKETRSKIEFKGNLSL